MPSLTAGEQEIWQLDAVINARGFATDGPLLEAASRVVATANASAQAEFRELTNLGSTNQVARFVAWLAEHGCPVKDVRKGTLKHALRRNGLAPGVRRAIELRLELAHASAGKVESLRSWRGDDGRVRGSLIYHGAATGRWVGRGPQPQNFKRDGEDTAGKISAILDGGAGLASPVEAVGEIARAMIVAAPGCRLLVADFSGIESRVLAWIAGQQSKVAAWRKFDLTGDPNDDPYVIIGRSLGHPEGTTRAGGKTADLAFGYQGGVGAWQNFAPEDDASDETTIKGYRDRWRAQHPMVVQFWYGTDRAAIRAIRNPGTEQQVGRLVFRYDEPFLRIRLPSGRSLSYPFARIYSDERGHDRVTFLDNAGGKFTDCRFGNGAYGGLWTENIVSAIARDLLAGALIRLEAAGYPVVLHVHDEIVAEVPDGFGDVEEFKRITVALPEWAAGLPVAAKVRNGPRFAKTAAEEPAAGSPPWEPEAPSAAPEPEKRAQAEPEPEAQVKHEQPRDERNDYASGEEPRGTARNAYVYANDHGDPWLRVIRTSNHTFPTFHWKNGGWVTGWPPHPFYPFRLKECLAAPADQPVIVCEGEKDCLTAVALGFDCTTCNHGGAGKWYAEHAKWFGGRSRAIIAEDNDAAGRAHVAKVATTLHAVGVQDIRIVRFTELDEHGDLSDWIALGHTREEFLARADAAPKFEPPKLPFINMSNWDNEPIPEQQWTVPDKIPRGHCAIFYGEGGAGKSMEGLHLCAAHSIKREIWFTLPEQGPALFVDTEDSEEVIHRRLYSVREHYDVRFEDLVKGGLHTMSLVGHDAVIAASSRTGKIEPTPLYQQLFEFAGDVKPIQIVIASAANVFAGNENDRSQVGQFINLLAGLGRVADGSVMLIAHPSLTGINSGSGMSGTTQWHNGPRARLYMKGVKPEEGELVDKDLREIVFMKNQYGAISSNIVLRYQDGMFLPVPGISSLDQAAQEAQADEIFVELIKRFTHEGRRAGVNPGKNYAPALFAKEDEAKRAMVNSRMLEGAMRRLFKAGTIWNEPCGKPSRPSYRIALRTGG